MRQSPIAASSGLRGPSMFKYYSQRATQRDRWLHWPRHLPLRRTAKWAQIQTGKLDSTGWVKDIVASCCVWFRLSQSKFNELP